MSSTTRKFCKFCNCWFADNKISIENHEKGVSHHNNVEKFQKNQQYLAAAEKALMAEMKRIEKVAIKALEEDAKRDPFAKDELERVIQAKRAENER